MTIHHLSRTLDVLFIALITLVFFAAIWPLVRDAYKRHKRRRAQRNQSTATDALKVIRKVMQTYYTGEARKLWDILTALRGPDNQDIELKLATTAVIRHAVYGYVNHGGTAAPDNSIRCAYRAKLDEAGYTKDTDHFINHAKDAFKHLNLKW